MIDKSGLDEIDVGGLTWNFQRLIVAYKTLEGKDFIDARKWVPTIHDDKYTPKGGLMLRPEHWLKTMKAINEMIERHSDLKVLKQ